MFGPRKAVKPLKSIFRPDSLPANSPVVVPNLPPAQVFEFPTFGTDDSLFKPKPAPPQPRKKKAAKPVEFDAAARREFLTGFHKRKVERTNARRERAKERDRIERRDERKERRSGKEQMAGKVLQRIEKVRDVVAGKIPVEELEKEEDEDDEMELPENDGGAVSDGSSESETEKVEVAKKAPKKQKARKGQKDPKDHVKDSNKDSTMVFSNSHSVTTVTTTEGLELDEFLDTVDPELLKELPKPKPKVEPVAPKKKEEPKKKKSGKSGNSGKSRAQGKVGKPGKHGSKKHAGKRNSGSSSR